MNERQIPLRPIWSSKGRPTTKPAPDCVPIRIAIYGLPLDDMRQCLVVTPDPARESLRVEWPLGIADVWSPKRIAKALMSGHLATALKLPKEKGQRFVRPRRKTQRPPELKLPDTRPLYTPKKR